MFFFSEKEYVFFYRDRGIVKSFFIVFRSLSRFVRIDDPESGYTRLDTRSPLVLNFEYIVHLLVPVNPRLRSAPRPPSPTCRSRKWLVSPSVA